MGERVGGIRESQGDHMHEFSMRSCHHAGCREARRVEVYKVGSLIPTLQESAYHRVSVVSK